MQGWSPVAVYSESGVCEQDCIFSTPNEKPDTPNLWIVTQHRASDYFVEMYKILPEGVVNKLEITLIEEENSQTKARLTVTQTAYTEAGKAEVAKFNQEAFKQYMTDWQTAMNYYLEKGVMIPDA